jgi:hypothetical protein
MLQDCAYGIIDQNAFEVDVGMDGARGCVEKRQAFAKL